MKKVVVSAALRYDGKSNISASISKPILLSAKDFGLEGAIETLRTVAGLSGITKTIPVTAHLEFTK